MNYRGAKPKHKLEPCPKCRMDSGKRMQTETVPEKFFIVCQSCGYTVGPCGSTSEATKKWDKEYRMKYIKQAADELGCKDVRTARKVLEEMDVPPVQVGKSKKYEIETLARAIVCARWMC